MQIQVQNQREGASRPSSRGDGDTNLIQSMPNESLHFVEDAEWLQAVQKHVEQNLGNSRYTITQLANAVAISERQMRRRLKKLLGVGPRQYLRQRRLAYAHQMLLNKQYKTLTQIAHAVGYRDVDSFRNIFIEAYGESPREYLR